MNITASYLTLAGATFGQPARHGITARARAAKLAGYSGIGALHTEVMPAKPARLPVPVTELEWLDLGTVTDATVAGMAAICSHLGTVTRINAGIGVGQVRSQHANTELAASLARWADMVAPTMIALEPVAFGELWHPARVMRLISMAGRPNVGFLWDTWHMSRAHEMGAGPVAVPTHLIAEVQLSGYRHHSADGFADAMNRGRTDAPAMAQLSALWARGWDGPVDTEITNPRLRAMPLAKMAQATYPGHLAYPMAARLGAMPPMMATAHTCLGLAAFGIADQYPGCQGVTA